MTLRLLEKERFLALKLCIQSDEAKFRLLSDGPAVLAIKALEERVSLVEGIER